MIETCLKMGYNLPFNVNANILEPESKRVRFDPAQDSDSSSSDHSSKLDTSQSSKNNSILNDENSYDRPGRPEIEFDGKFNSFAEFEEVFLKWKEAGCHPFRVASSETLKEPNGSINSVHKYRYVVYHCAHYGNPRVRGTGKRPCKNYLACGCQAVLRLNYKFNEKALRITTLNVEHNHPTDPHHFALSQKSGRSPASTKIRRFSNIKSEHQVPASPLSQSSSSPPSISPTAPHSPSSTVSSTTISCKSNGSSGVITPAPATGMPNITAALLYQQQLINVLLAQHNLQKQKESLERLAQQGQEDVTKLGFNNVFDINSQLGVTSLLNMSPFTMNQANLMIPSIQPKLDETSEEIDVVNEVKPPAGLITPKAVRPTTTGGFSYPPGGEATTQLKEILHKVYESSQDSSVDVLNRRISILASIRDQWKASNL